MSDNRRNKGRLFRRFGIITIAAVYLLILVGGIVRSTGSGMGCPDWPKCFGNWVPPTEVSQLPPNYKEVYAEKRKQKNDRLAVTLHRLGLTSAAERITGDPSVYVEADFNPTKTWIEYVNRLIGVLIGFFIFLTAIFSIHYRKHAPRIMWLSLLAFVLVGVEGWLGSIVVSTNLLPGMITLHMLLAIVIVCLLIYAVTRSYEGLVSVRVTGKKGQINFLLVLTLVFSVAQVILGTQVREEIDTIATAMQGTRRNTWIDQIGVEFYVHRSFSILVLAANLCLAFLLQKHTNGDKSIRLFVVGLLAAVIISVLSGIAMAYLAIPAILQPIHLLLATLLAGIQFTLLLLLNHKEVLRAEVVAESTSKQFSYQ